ncbi:hypothetical protein Patl1_14944 [Pistacia atlantica]|uniref:Uncharacterized protein n=1 Tax=Pistacia atlantica TaxID=434234 RepID=A0ACC1B6Z6_9ROSI|nr:hypothetical protein Patl1_14944 [Pistacia atlantica]
MSSSRARNFRRRSDDDEDNTDSTPSTVSAAATTTAGTYTKEALLELQKNTKTLAAPSSKPPPSSEPTIVLKGLLKPQNSTFFEDKPSRVSSDSDSDNKDDTEKRFASMGIAKGKDLIPDKATIEAIRAKRERMRLSRGRAAPDYISLEGGSDQRLGGEDLSDEEPEFPRRVAMFGEKLESDKKNMKKGVFEDEEEEEDERPVVVGNAGKKNVEDDEYDDEDEVAKMWEEEQVRKGLGKRIDDSSAAARVVSSATTSVPMSQQPLVQPQKLYPTAAPPSIGGAIGALQGFDTMSISQKGENAIKAVNDNINRLKETNGRVMSSLTKADEDLSASLLKITDLESSLSAAGEKFIFMQKLRDFISVICEFLQVCFYLILCSVVLCVPSSLVLARPFTFYSCNPRGLPLFHGLLVHTFVNLLRKLRCKSSKKERASTLLERRAADNDDEMIEVEAAVKAAMAVFNERGNNAAMIAAAKSAAQAASSAIREQTNLPVKLDEFGRDMNLQKRMDMTRRAEARQRGRARFESKRLSSVDIDSSNQKMEGESSTDESDSESSAYQSNRELVLQHADEIFSDASEEYSQLSLVKERFEKWKREYSSSHRDAYMSLIMVCQKMGEILPLDDADANLVPTLVEKVALPILHHEIAHCWDMLSTRETKNAVSATSLVVAYVPTSSEALADLLLAIRTRLAEAVSNLTVPAWSPLLMNAVPNAARIAAYRFGMSVRLMRNICLWKEILALPILEELVLDEILCRKVLPHVRSITSNVHDAIMRTEKIVASLSGVWSGSSVTGSRSRGLARRLKKMLVELNEYDNARNIARTFRLKEAL